MIKGTHPSLEFTLNIKIFHQFIMKIQAYQHGCADGTSMLTDYNTHDLDEGVGSGHFLGLTAIGFHPEVRQRSLDKIDDHDLSERDMTTGC